MNASNRLPMLDLGLWYTGSEVERASVAAQLLSASRGPGFFYLDHHRVPDPLLSTMTAQSQRFFSLPLSEKMALHFEKTRKQRGYIPEKAESSDPGAKGDVKEALDFTYPIPPLNVSDSVAYRMYGPNLWPEGLPGFQETVEAYFQEMLRLGRDLFAILAKGLTLPADYFEDKTDRPIAQLRMLHYPRQDGPIDSSQLGIGAHCDYECFTILHTGDIAGLQIQDSRGTWQDVVPRPGSFVVNLGEMLARWTNDLLRATPHRVINQSRSDRYSIPFFFGTNYDTPIECLPTCRGPERPPRYRSVLAGEYLAKRLSEVYGSLREIE